VKNFAMITPEKEIKNQRRASAAMKANLIGKFKPMNRVAIQTAWTLLEEK